MDHCEECGFDFNAVPPDDVSARVQKLPQQFAEHLRDAERAGLARRRPRPETWSALEYTCHVRDVLRVQRERIQMAIEEDHPDFAPMGRDERAVDERYNEQDIETVLEEFAIAAGQAVSILDGLVGEQWHRTGLFHWPETAERSVEWLARQTLHEGVHHLYDIKAGIVFLTAPEATEETSL